MQPRLPQHPTPSPVRRPNPRVAAMSARRLRRRPTLAAIVMLVLASLQASPSHSTDTQAATPPASADRSPVVLPASHEGGFRYRLRVDAPSALRPLIEANVGLARWQEFEDMTPPLFDRLARVAC